MINNFDGKNQMTASCGDDDIAFMNGRCRAGSPKRALNRGHNCLEPLTQSRSRLRAHQGLQFENIEITQNWRERNFTIHLKNRKRVVCTTSSTFNNLSKNLANLFRPSPLAKNNRDTDIRARSIAVSCSPLLIYPSSREQ